MFKWGVYGDHTALLRRSCLLIHQRGELTGLLHGQHPQQTKSILKHFCFVSKTLLSLVPSSSSYHPITFNFTSCFVYIPQCSIMCILSIALLIPLLCFSVPQLTPREKATRDYNQKLRQKFQHHPQVRRIARHRHLPHDIYKQRREIREMKEARRRKYVPKTIWKKQSNEKGQLVLCHLRNSYVLVCTCIYLS